MLYNKKFHNTIEIFMILVYNIKYIGIFCPAFFSRKERNGFYLMNKILDILKNKWVKFGVSFLTLGFPVFILFVDWLAFAYYFEPVNAVPLFLLYVLCNVIFGGIMFYTRKQIITKIVVCISPLLSFLLLIIAFGQWYLIIPPVVICVLTFLACNANETFKTILGTVYLLMFVVGTLVYLTMLHFNLTVQSLLEITECDLSKRYDKYDYSDDGSYRLVRYYDEETAERRSATFYVERTKEDIKLPYLNCYKHLGSQKVLVTMYQDEITYEWISDNELFIDGRIKDLDEIFEQAELERLKPEEEEKETDEEEVYLTYYERQGIEEEKEESGVKKPIVFEDSAEAEADETSAEGESSEETTDSE